MSEENVETEIPEATQLDKLKKRADLLGVKYKVNVTLETLQRKIKEHTEAGGAEEPKPAPTLTKGQILVQRRKAANKLVRCRISCMNPNKSAWEGEIICASSPVYGSIKKYIQFNKPFHVPQAILNVLLERKCQLFEKTRGRLGTTSKARLAAEFNIEILAPLTEKERQQIATRQAAQATMNG